jgi:hypothetical protein
MSRGHSTSRRRNYGRRQREIRRRQELDLPIDLQGPDAWPRGSGWAAASDPSSSAGSSRSNSYGHAGGSPS